MDVHCRRFVTNITYNAKWLLSFVSTKAKVRIRIQNLEKCDIDLHIHRNYHKRLLYDQTFTWS